MPFNPNDYGPVLSELLDVDRLRPLDAAKPQASRKALTEKLTLETAFAHTTIVDEDMARCVLSGVLLFYDRLDESHTFSQSINTPEGSFWHGIMHRREGDFSNAKYWFRKVGDHDVFARISERVAEVLDNADSLLVASAWEPFSFVDACETALRSGKQIDLCRKAQQIECEVLLDHCYGEAT